MPSGNRGYVPPSVTIPVGTATAPYQPLEDRFRLTRRCLEVRARYRTPITLITKGPMVRRDVPVLQELGRRAGCTWMVTVPTVDDAVWRRTEPGTPAPHHRLRAVRHLVRAGIRAGGMLAPPLPGISDGRAAIGAAVRPRGNTRPASCTRACGISNRM